MCGCIGLYETNLICTFACIMWLHVALLYVLCVCLVACRIRGILPSNCVVQILRIRPVLDVQSARACVPLRCVALRVAF